MDEVILVLLIIAFLAFGVWTEERRGSDGDEDREARKNDRGRG